MLADRQVALIGGGHIAEIIIHRLTQGKVLSGARIIVSDPAPSRREHLSGRFGITPAVDNVEAAQRGDLVLICVRPEVVQAILPDLQAARLGPDQVIVSVAAGIPLSTYESLGEKQPLVRALPNPPSRVGQGIAPLVFSPAVRTISPRATSTATTPRRRARIFRRMISSRFSASAGSGPKRSSSSSRMRSTSASSRQIARRL